MKVAPDPPADSNRLDRLTLARGSAQSGARQLPSRQCPVCGELFPGDYRICPRDLVDLVEPDADVDPLVGAILNDTYQILRQIGEGGVAKVYEAKHTRLGGSYAVKVLHEVHARQREMCRRFCKEAETTSSIRHENVIEVYDVDATENGIPYIVYELLAGADLGEVLDREGTLAETTAATIIMQVCRALAAAHEHGVVHRDLKPENVYIIGGLNRPKVKLLDFGIARVEDPAKAMNTRTGFIMGTPAFMAPEQAQGAKVDHRADIYSVGAILYRILTGQCAHERGDPAQTLSAVLTEDPVRPRELAPWLSGAFELVIQRAMARKLEDRYQSIGALEQELRPFAGRVTDEAAARARPSGSALPVPAAGRNLVAAASRQSRGARPWIVASMLLISLWSYGLVVEILAHVLTLVTGSAPVGTELLLVTLGVAAAMVTPIILWAKLVRRTMWRNSVLALAAARRLRAFVGASLATYGLGTLGAALVGRFVSLAPVQSRLQLTIAAASIIVGTIAHAVSRRNG